MPSCKVDDGPRPLLLADYGDAVAVAKVHAMDTNGGVRRELVDPLQGSAATVVQYDDGMPS